MVYSARQILNQSNEFVVIDTNILALIFTLDECTFLHRLNFWIQGKLKTQEDTGIQQLGYRKSEKRMYVFKTIRASQNSKTRSWLQELPFFSERSFTRMTKGLVDRGIIITGTFNKFSADKTIWYTIDYDKLDDYCNKQLPVALRKITLNEIKWEVDTWFKQNGDQFGHLNNKKEISYLISNLKKLPQNDKKIQNTKEKIEDLRKRANNNRQIIICEIENLLIKYTPGSYKDVSKIKVEVISDIYNKHVTANMAGSECQYDLTESASVANSELSHFDSSNNQNISKNNLHNKNSSDDDEIRINKLLESEIPQIKEILEAAYRKDGFNNLQALEILSESLYSALVSFDFSNYKQELLQSNKNIDHEINFLYQDCIDFAKKQYRGAGDKKIGFASYVSKAIDNRANFLYK